MAERNGSALRRRLDSAERLSESAIARGVRLVNTPGSRSSASLVCITRLDHRFAPLAGMRLDLAAWLLPDRGRRRDVVVAISMQPRSAKRVPWRGARPPIDEVPTEIDREGERRTICGRPARIPCRGEAIVRSERGIPHSALPGGAAPRGSAPAGHAAY